MSAPAHLGARTRDPAPAVQLDLPTVADLIRAKRARLARFASLSRAPRRIRGRYSSAEWRTMSRDQRAEHLATLAVVELLDAVDEVRDRRALRR